MLALLIIVILLISVLDAVSPLTNGSMYPHWIQDAINYTTLIDI